MDTTFAAFNRLKELLKTGGMDEESINFIVGKYTHAATDKVMAEVVTVGGEAALKKLVEGAQDAALAELEAKFKEAKGKTIGEFREEVATQMVADFEAAA